VRPGERELRQQRGSCEDDDHEPDGTPAQAMEMAPLGDGSLDGRVLCGGDEDWYALEVDAPSQVTVSLTGDVPPDIDLSLTTAAGVLLDASEGFMSSELVEPACLDPGTYLVRVYSIDADPPGAYALELQQQACDGGGGGGDCCVAGDGPGCDDPTIEACVCGADPFCCDQEWDAMCVAGVETHACGTCP
jgi:Bacterial pre-peptidase C-terminal domain